jgi:hypothetical protein
VKGRSAKRFLLLALLSTLAWGDVSFEQVLKTTNYLGTGRSEARSKIMIKGDCSRTETTVKIAGLVSGAIKRRSVTIVRLDRQLIWSLMPEKDLYAEITFEELRKMMAPNAPAAASGRARVEGRRTGETRKIIGLACERVIVSMQCLVSDPESGQPVAGVFTNDMWITKLAPVVAEIERFNRRLSQAAGIRESNQEILSAFGISGDDYAAFERKTKEYNGFPVFVDMSLSIGNPLSNPPSLVLFSARNEVKKISAAQIDQDVFELPGDYKLGGRGGLFQ